MDISPELHRLLDNAVTRLAKQGRAFLDDGDLGVAATTLKDAADLQHIHGLVGRGDTAAAIRRINQLDTAARDEIPVRAYAALMKHA